MMIMMTREELKFEIEFYKSAIKAHSRHSEFLKEKLQDFEKQVAELDIEVYVPIYLSQSGHNYAITKNGKSGSAFEKYLERHNAGEELKKIISEENAKQGWKIDWKDERQDKYNIMFYNHAYNDIHIASEDLAQAYENELYFSEQSSQDQNFIDKIKPLWLIWKGIE